MKNLNKFSIALTVPVLFFSSCNQLKKFIKKQKEIVYNVSPNPIEMHGDSIQFSVSGKFNPKLFPTKVTATVIPVIKYEGGEKELKSITLVGEKAVGSGQKNKLWQRRFI